MRYHTVKLILPSMDTGCFQFITVIKWNHRYVNMQFRSVAQSCPTLCDPMNRSTPGLPVHHQLPEFTQTHIHRVSDAIQPSHPLSSPSPPATNPSQHQSLFQWVKLFPWGGRSINKKKKGLLYSVNGKKIR